MRPVDEASRSSPDGARHPPNFTGSLARARALPSPVTAGRVAGEARAALSASRSKNTFLARYRHLAARRSPVRALVVIELSTLTAVWHMLARGEAYTDPGAHH